MNGGSVGLGGEVDVEAAGLEERERRKVRAGPVVEGG
jgi:hypothetical protein